MHPNKSCVSRIVISFWSIDPFIIMKCSSLSLINILKSTWNIVSLALSFIYLFIYLFLAVLGLRCCAQAFSSCGEQGLLFIAVHRLLIVVASLIVEHGL